MLNWIRNYLKKDKTNSDGKRVRLKLLELSDSERMSIVYENLTIQDAIAYIKLRDPNLRTYTVDSSIPNKFIIRKAIERNLTGKIMEMDGRLDQIFCDHNIINRLSTETKINLLKSIISEDDKDSNGTD